ncbi:type II toxin-antitoxin system HicA family toxin [Patescibacteria group bacterium]|nr:type II toxin-antitoxin system HicA family toxin [Patescibacteria group bacterium]MBU1673389.1 type II toxin-antitoxin system HicA family toxin [Patescibacteria group bacterium]MBU1963285.1 type II toxin-antitoxin system HicA family toxin [Patescibacteria group bacterium]
MPKLPAITSKKLVRTLKALGFVEDHQTGSHKIFYHPKTKKRAVVPFHVKDLPKGTLLAILKEAGLEKKDL